MMVRLSALRPGGSLGRVPTAISTLSVDSRRRPSTPSTCRVCSSMNEASPANHLDVVARQVLLDDEELAFDDPLHVVDQLIHGGAAHGAGTARSPPGRDGNSRAAPLRGRSWKGWFPTRCRRRRSSAAFRRPPPSCPAWRPGWRRAGRPDRCRYRRGHRCSCSCSQLPSGGEGVPGRRASAGRVNIQYSEWS